MCCRIFCIQNHPFSSESTTHTWRAGVLYFIAPFQNTNRYLVKADSLRLSCDFPRVDRDNYQQLLGALDYSFLCAYAIGMYLR